MNRTAFRRDFAVMKNRRQPYYLMPKYYTSDDGRPMLYGFANGFKVYPNILVLKGYPLSTLFNNVIMQLHSNGLIGKWDSEFSNKKYPVANVHRPLTISHLQTGFIYLGVGTMVATLVFGIEICVNKCKNRKISVLYH